MSYNLLRTLPRSGFEGLETLETVDLSFNDLREIDERAFDDLPWLATLKVRGSMRCERLQWPCCMLCVGRKLLFL